MITLLALAQACGDAPTPPASGVADLGGLVVSAARGLTEPGPKAFVSLPAGATSGREVIVTNRVNGSSVRRTMVDGGFDPLPIAALPGEELSVDIPGSGKFTVRVPSPLPPVIVRTDPARRRASVPLNTSIILVFSEPMDPATVTPRTIRLVGELGEEPIALDMRDEGTVVVAHPLAGLRPGANYYVEIGRGIADLSGDHPVATDRVEFSTAAITTGAPWAIRLCPDTLRLPVGTTSGFVVLIDSGATRINNFPDPRLTWASRDTTVVRVTPAGHIDGRTMGQAWVTVTYQGDTDSALVIVTSWPPPGPFGVWPGGAIMPIGHTDHLEVSHPEGTPAPVVTWSVSDPRIIAIDTAGNVTGLAAGVAWAIARSGTDADSAEIEVYDPTPKLGQLFIIRPDSILFQPGDYLYLTVNGPTAPPPVTWTVDDTAIASIDAHGSINARAIGRSTVTAHFADGSATTATVIVVAAGTLGHIALRPLAPTVHVGDTLRLQLDYDDRARELWGTSGTSWTLVGSAMTMQMRVVGSFIAVSPGQVTIRAYAGPLVAEVVATVVP